MEGRLLFPRRSRAGRIRSRPPFHDRKADPPPRRSRFRRLAAMSAVPRHEFVPAEFRKRAYEDAPLPIGEGQTISQPYIVAAMTAALHLKGTERVLEIGGGCGYQAAGTRVSRQRNRDHRISGRAGHRRRGASRAPGIRQRPRPLWRRHDGPAGVRTIRRDSCGRCSADRPHRWSRNSPKVAEWLYRLVASKIRICILSSAPVIRFGPPCSNRAVLSR